MRTNLPVTQKNYDFPADQTLISVTDPKGRITYGNANFVQVSGYSIEELMGQPHNLLRHPDMPRAAFKDLWTTVAAGKKWHGYVKNLCKDGSHYWVYATAVPNVRGGKIVGYTSVRRQPSRAKIAEITATYKEWLAKEGSPA